MSGAARRRAPVSHCTQSFNALIGDVFPGAKIQDVQYEKLEKAIMDVLAEDKLEVLPLQVRKIMQFYEATQQRMGVMIVGPSGCGKSTIWKVLQKALGKLGTRIPMYVMNPKRCVHRILTRTPCTHRRSRGARSILIFTVCPASSCLVSRSTRVPVLYPPLCLLSPPRSDLLSALLLSESLPTEALSPCPCARPHGYRHARVV